MSGINPIGLPDWQVDNPDHTPWEEEEDGEEVGDEVEEFDGSQRRS